MSLVNRDLEKAVNNENIEVVYEKPKRSIFSYIKIIFILIVVFGIGGIFAKGLYDSSKTLDVDNPTGSGITIQFNDMEEVTIPANTFMEVELSTGKYVLKVNGVDMGTFEKSFMDSGFLNPTNSIYIIEHVLYGDGSHADKLPNNKIEAYGNEAEGPFEKVEGIYITEYTNYDLDESFPDEVKMKKSSSYKIKTKMYRFNDFADMYNRDYVSE